MRTRPLAGAARPARRLSRVSTDSRSPGSTALLTDHYELTMVRAALHSGTAAPALGVRGLRPLPAARPPVRRRGRHRPAARRAGATSGSAPTQLEFLHETGIADEPTLRFLESYRFSGDIWGYAEGDCYFPGSPILVVEGTFAEAVILETLSLSVLNHDCAIAAAGLADGARPRPAGR